MSAAVQTNYLDPADLTFFRAPDGDVRLRLQYKDEWCCQEVRLARLLPLSNPDEYWALRDGDDQEIGVLQSLSGLPDESRRLLADELRRRYFVPKVLSVTKVRDEFGVVVFDVITDAGPRQYTVRNLRDNSVPLTSSRVLMTDVDGNRFEFPDVNKVSAAAQDVLMKVI